MRRILKWKAPVAFLGAFFMLAQAAGAATPTFDFTLANTAASAYSNSTSNITFDEDEAASMQIELPTGWDVAQQTGTSPLSPIPADGDTVGTGTATARFLPFGCSSAETNNTMTAKWESTIDASAPAGTVAQVNITVAALFTTKAFIVRNGAQDYDIEVPDMPDQYICSSTTNGAMTLTLYGQITVSGTTKYIARNPSTTGAKQATMRYTGTSGTSYVVNDSVTIT